MNFQEFAARHGLILRSFVRGKIERCQTESHPHKKNGAFFYDLDFGWIQDWSQHAEPIYWKDETPRTPEEILAIKQRIEANKKQHELEREQNQRKASAQAAHILSQCELNRHAYFDSKGFPDTLGNVFRDGDKDPELIIPMYNGKLLCGIQRISITGDKKFLFGQRTSGACFQFGQSGRVFLVEGYATGLSLQVVLSALKIPSIIRVCFSAGNVLKMALPGNFIIADNDTSKTGERIAIASGCDWWMPEKEGDDFNDLWKREGTFKSAMILRKVLHNSVRSV